ncbi:MAG: hypothetical protein U0838_13645 [Chloroflexota bacterium]
MTHEYTILTGGVVVAAVDGCAAPSAVAWALDTVLAVGGDADVLAISRGDSRVADLHGALVTPDAGAGPLEPGDRADFTIRDAATGEVLAEIRAGQIVAGDVPGFSAAQPACRVEA